MFSKKYCLWTLFVTKCSECDIYIFICIWVAGLYMEFCLTSALSVDRWHRVRHWKIHFIYKSNIWAKTILHKKCANCNKSEFATKQRKLYLTKKMSKIRLPHIYGGNNYVINNKFSTLKNKSEKFTKCHKYYLTKLKKQRKLWP